MTHEIAVTCVIPTHDRPELLKQSIDSVLGQVTKQSFELLVTDDVASPRSEGVVLNVAQNAHIPIRYLPRLGPSGASASRNFAAVAACGEMLAFLDDDDLWEETFLEQAVDALRSTRADMAVVWLKVLDLDGVIAPLFELPLDLAPPDVAAWNVGFTGSNFLIKKSVFDALGGFDPELQVSNDKDFFLRFLSDGYRYTVVPEFLAIHRRHAGPQLTVGNERRAAGVEAYLRKHKSVLTLSGRRQLRKKIHKIRLRTSASRGKRWLHALGFVANLSLGDVQSKWRRRNGRYAPLR